MEGKVLLIDFDGTRKNRIFYRMFLKWLRHDGLEVTELYFDNLSFFDASKQEEVRLSIDKSVDAAKDIDLVYVHFGSMQRPEAAQTVARLKSLGVKVIVESVSPILFEAADYVFGMNVSELQENIKRLCQEKNRS